MGLAFAVVYATPFVQYVFYDDLAGALHATNTQLGFLIAIFGIGNLLAPFGGALSDKFNTKKVYLLGMFITCALNFFLAMNMSYTFAIFIWAGLAVAGLILYFPAHTKLVRLVGMRKARAPYSDLRSQPAAWQALLSILLPWDSMPRWRWEPWEAWQD